MWKIRMFFRKVKNLLRWFPIIWKDEDWDDHYIFEILKFKLKNQAKYIGDKDRHTLAKRDAEIMMLCVSLIDKVQEEYYNTEHLDYEESNFNFIPISHTTFNTSNAIIVVIPKTIHFWQFNVDIFQHS